MQVTSSQSGGPLQVGGIYFEPSECLATAFWLSSAACGGPCVLSCLLFGCVRVSRKVARHKQTRMQILNASCMYIHVHVVLGTVGSLHCGGKAGEACASSKST